MNKVMKFRYRILALLVLAVVLSAATYGFAAANTVDPSAAGEGQGVISGYNIYDVTYNLSPSNPNVFSNVSFNMVDIPLGNPAPASAEVYAGIGDGTDIDWVTCSPGAIYHYDCALTTVNVSVTAAIEFHVAAAD